MDNVIVIRSPSYATIFFDGYKVSVEPNSSFMKSQLCGLCGSFNGKISTDLTGPTKCIYSKPEIFVASYRVGTLPSKSCGPLDPKISAELKKETEECSKFIVVPTKVHCTVYN